MARLASLVSAALQAAAADPSVEPQLLARLQAVQDMLAAKPLASSKSAALKLLAEIRPCWGHCQACGKHRYGTSTAEPTRELIWMMQWFLAAGALERVQQSARE